MTGKQAGTFSPTTLCFISSLYSACAQLKGVTHGLWGQISPSKIRAESVASLPGREEQTVKQPSGE